MLVFGGRCEYCDKPTVTVRVNHYTVTGETMVVDTDTSDPLYAK